MEGVSIKVAILPVLLDGKVKATWCNTGFNGCYICLATAQELALQDHPKFHLNPEDRIRYGICPLHALIQSFKWLIKGCTYRDIRAYEAVGDAQKALRTRREMEMEVSFTLH